MIDSKRGNYLAMLLLVALGTNASLVEADQVPDEWRNMHCPNAVPEGSVIQTPYLDKIQDYGVQGDEEKRDAYLAQANRYRLCSIFIHQQSFTPLSAYESREISIEAGAPPESIKLYSLETILDKSEEMTGDSDRINEVVEKMYRTAYTEEYAHMGDKEAMRKLTETYFCECLNIPTEEFEDL